MFGWRKSKKKRQKVVRERKARVDTRRKLRHEFDDIVKLLTQGQIESQEAITLLRSQSAEIGLLKRGDRERKYHIRLLSKLPDIGVKVAQKLLDEFGSLQAIVNATPEELQTVDGIGSKRAQTVSNELKKLVPALSNDNAMDGSSQ